MADNFDNSSLLKARKAVRESKRRTTVSVLITVAVVIASVVLTSVICCLNSGISFLF